MSIRFLADNDLMEVFVAATRRRERAIDFKSARTARLDSLDDQAVLQQAAAESRILVTHDKRSMPKELRTFLASGGVSPGVLVVIPQNALLTQVVDTLVLIWADNRPGDWVSVITKIPF